MNRIYSKVWNRSLGMLVVASEFAKRSHGSAGATRRTHPRVGIAALTLAVCGAFSIASVR